MKFYNKYYRSNYEELITYYPRFYREVFEMVEILKVHGRISDWLEEHIEQTYLNNFIMTADLETVKTWERILDITYTRDLTLDQRKNVIVGRISGYGHIGEPEIRGIIAHYTENAVAVDFALGVIYITIEGEIFDENNLLDTLLRRIPAHLALKMTVQTIRTSVLNLNFKFGGATGQEIRADLASIKRREETTLKVSNKAYTYGHFDALPHARDRTATDTLQFAYGGFSYNNLDGIPHAQDGMTTETRTLSYTGTFETEMGDKPPDVENVSAGLTESAGGAYCRTHITSKLIKGD